MKEEKNNIDKISELIQTGKEEEENGNSEKAVRCYQDGVNRLKHERKYSKNELLNKTLDEKIEEYETRINLLQKPKKEEITGSTKDQGELRRTIESSILEGGCSVKWTDVIGLEAAKGAVREAVVHPLRYPSLFTGKRRPWRGILLYGPPGTGKSFMAKAAATEAKCTFFSVSSSTLVSKYVGESEKLVRTLFEIAREMKPSIIFIDELDSLCTERGDNESEGARRIKTELLVQMDGVGNDQTGVLVFGATNLPWKLDPAFRRRFEKKIYIGLQLELERAEMIKVHIGNEKNTLTEKEIRFIGKKTEGYSGSDISHIVRDSLMQTVRRMQTGECFKKTNINGKIKYMPCSPGDKDAIKMTLNDIEDDCLEAEPLTFSDLIKSLEKVKPSVSEKDIEMHMEFTREFGQED